MNSPDWKNQLAGLDMPAEPSAWPPSLLAMALATGLALLVLVLARQLYRRWHRNRWRRAARRECAQIAALQDGRQFSALLRRVALHTAGPAVASLGDQAFAEHLRRACPAIPTELATQMASCAHRPDVQLGPRHWEAARRYIEAQSC